MIITKGEGCFMYENGVEYLDFTSGGIFHAPFGIQDAGIRAVLAEDKPFATYGAHYRSPPVERLKDMLKEFTGYESAVLFSTGAEATEAFWRCCRVYTGKPNIWGGQVDPDDVGNDNPMPDAMHGMTLGALIMAGRMTWPGMDPTGAFQGRYAQSQDATACAIWEPYHAPSGQFYKDDPTINRLKLIIKDFPDILHCSDEIQAGMGRTGKVFGYQWYPDLGPRFVTVGKMLGGGLPLSALLGPKDILEDPYILENAHLHSTHSGNPLMAAVGCEVIRRIQAEDLVTHSYKMGIILEDELIGLEQRHHCGKGLLAGIEFSGPVQARKVVEACRRRGLLVVDTGRKWVKVGPPLIISEEQILTGCEILKSAIEEVLNEPDIEACGDFGQESGQGDTVLSGDGVQRSDVQPGGMGESSTPNSENES